MRALILFCLALACSGLQAQTLPPETPQPLEGRRNQKIERIRVEDGGARIDELRVGGQTQSITVQPKANVPAYEFQPTDLARSRPAENRDSLSSPSSQRVWNLLKF